MITVPFYGLVIVPNVTYYFQKDYFNEISSKGAEVQEEVIFLMLKEEKKLSEVAKEDFYPIGAVGYIDSIDESGNVAVKVTDRVQFDSIEMEEGTYSLEYTKREEAIKKQIEVLQKELDEMHPESLTDIRKFELKIADSGMNDTAKKEAEKILNRIRQDRFCCLWGRREPVRPASAGVWRMLWEESMSGLALAASGMRQRSVAIEGPMWALCRGALWKASREAGCPIP